MHGPTNPDELRAAADLAGIADVIAVEDGHALLRFVRLTKGKPRRHPDDPFPHDLPGTAAVDLASTDPEVFRPGLRVETHLVRGSIAFRGIGLAWDDHTILGRTPTAPAPSVTEPSPGWRRHVVADPLRPGEAAASLVHPEDWRAEGFVAYIPGNGDANALVFARAQARDGTRSCEIYPDEHFGGDTSAYLAVEDLPEDLWSSREMTVGGRLFGRVMMQGAVPGNHVFSLEKSVIPKYRGHLGDLHVYRPWRYWDQTRDMMDLLRIEPRDGLAYEYVEQEIAYSLGGVRFRETFMAIGYRRAGRTVTPCPWFGLLALRSYRAPEGESGVRECLEVLRSFEPDPAWRERCARMHCQLVEGDHAPLRDLDRAMRAAEAREGAERAAYFARPEPDEAPRPSGRRDASRARRRARGELYDPPAYHALPTRAGPIATRGSIGSSGPTAPARSAARTTRHSTPTRVTARAGPGLCPSRRRMMREPDETEMAEMLAEADLAGVADVLAVRDGHALIKFVKLTKGRPPRETPPPFDASGGAGFLTAVVALRAHDVDEANHRPGLRIRTHLAHRRPFEPLFRTLAPWNSVTVLGEVLGPGPGIVPGRRRSG